MPSTTGQAQPAPAPSKSVSQALTSPTAEELLQKILDSLSASQLSSKTPNTHRHWVHYERVAKQHDEEFWERHNGKLDVLLIFAGLFSAVTSAFIVDMKGDLKADPLEMTNTLLKILIHTMNATAFSGEDLSLPDFHGPDPSTVRIQGLAYASLAASLLSAFGAVLCKQWLYHFKTSRLGQGTIEERCKCRQFKIDGMEAWHFEMICNALPFILQLSLLLFGIALSLSLWESKKTLAIIIISITSFGAFCVVVASLLVKVFPQGPFQLFVLAYMRDGVNKFLRRVWRNTYPINSFLLPFSHWKRNVQGTAHPFHPLKNVPFTSDTTAATIDWIVQKSTEPDVQFEAFRLALTVEWPPSMNISGIALVLESLHEQYCHGKLEAPLAKERYEIIANTIFHLSFMYSSEQLERCTSTKLKQFFSWHGLASSAFQVAIDPKHAPSDPFPNYDQLNILVDRLEVTDPKESLWPVRRIIRKIFLEEDPKILGTLLKLAYERACEETASSSSALLCLFAAFKVIGVTVTCPTQATETFLLNRVIHCTLLVRYCLLAILDILEKDMKAILLSQGGIQAPSVKSEQQELAFDVLRVSLPKVFPQKHPIPVSPVHFLQFVVSCLNAVEHNPHIPEEDLYRVARHFLEVAVTLICIGQSPPSRKGLLQNLPQMEPVWATNWTVGLREAALLRYIKHQYSTNPWHPDAITDCLLLAHNSDWREATNFYEYLKYLVNTLKSTVPDKFKQQVFLAAVTGLFRLEPRLHQLSHQQKEEIKQALHEAHCTDPLAAQLIHSLEN